MTDEIKKRGPKPIDYSLISDENIKQKLEHHRHQINTNSKTYYEKIKQDPEKYKHFLNRCKINTQNRNRRIKEGLHSQAYASEQSLHIVK